MPLFQTPGSGIARGSGSVTAAGFTWWGRPAPPGEAEPGGLDEPCRAAPSVSLVGSSREPFLSPQCAHSGCWAAVSTQPLAGLLKPSLAQVRAPGCPSTPKNTPRPRFVVIPAQVRAQCPLVALVVFAAAPRAGALTSPQRLRRGAQPQICPGFPFKIASSPPVPARRQQEGKCTDEKCRGPKFIFQRWQQSQ